MTIESLLHKFLYWKMRKWTDSAAMTLVRTLSEKL